MVLAAEAYRITFMSSNKVLILRINVYQRSLKTGYIQLAAAAFDTAWTRILHLLALQQHCELTQRGKAEPLANAPNKLAPFKFAFSKFEARMSAL